MSDHEFERQVRQKLNNLKLSPTPQAWENIEEKLRERRRRTPLLWLSLFVGVMAVGGYLMLTDQKSFVHGSRQTTSNINVSDAPVSQQHPSETTSKKSIDPAPDQTNIQPGVQSSTTAGQHQRSPDNNSIADSKILKTEHGRAIATAKKSFAPLPDEPNGQPELRSSTKVGKPQHFANDNSITDGTGVRPEHGNAIHGSPKNKTSAGSADITAENETVDDQSQARQSSPSGAQVAPASDAASLTPHKDPTSEKAVKLLSPPGAQPGTAVPAVTKPAAKARHSKWAYAINLQAGISGENQSGIYGFNKPKVEDIAYTMNFAATVVNYAPVYKPSTISPGLTFSAGAEVKRELSKRFSVSAGLNYTQFNTRSQVGDKINSGNIVNNGVRGYLYVQSYYTLDQNDNVEYKNKYHFVELPLTLHTRLNRSEALPIYWDAGFIVSRLISSTSLHFDGSTGVYYKNDRLLTQTQAAVATGFSFALFNKTSHPIWIGPSARSNISSILRKDVSSDKHFVTLGLDLKFFLKK